MSRTQYFEEEVLVTMQDEDLRGNLEAGKYEPYVRHIRFPRFKNVAEGTRIDFTYPITALVGANGTSKSSILRAVQCCADYESMENYWFATSLDPIDDGERHRYIHGYRVPSGLLVESVKTRIAKKDNPDYWEPSRPLLTGHDRMERMGPVSDTLPEDRDYRTQTRWRAIQKRVVHIDFRQLIAAFDLFYRLDGGKRKRDRPTKKRFLRERTAPVKKAMDLELTESSYRGAERIVTPCESLSEKQTRWVSKILGREYSSIRLIEHSFYEISGYTVTLESGKREYSEAFAGSGEYAVVLLVKQITEAPDSALIILDEPEVSLHPEAQKELMRFLRIQSIARKQQIVIATHSPMIVEGLPADAIKMIEASDYSGKSTVRSQETFASDAFHRLGLSAGKRQIFVEDALAAELVKAALIRMKYSLDAVTITVLGGADKIKGKNIPSLVAQGNRGLLLLDGDQRLPRSLPRPEYLSDDGLIDTIAMIGISKGDLGLNGGNAGNRKQHLEVATDVITWARDYLRFLPSENPEQFLIEALRLPAEEEETSKGFWARRAREIFSGVSAQDPSGEDILSVQRMAIGQLPPDSDALAPLQKTLKEYFERRMS